MADVKILVVMDDNNEAIDIKRTLESLGFSVPYLASRTEEAVEKTSELMPDLVLMDLILKGEMDSIDAASLIKDFKIPVIFLINNSEKIDIEKVKLSEPYAFLTKPYDDNELQCTIELAIYKSKIERKLSESEEFYRNLFETTTMGVIYQDGNGEIISANPAAEKILGLSIQQMKGRTSTDPRWRSIREDGSDFPGKEHPSMIALKTGKKVKNTIMGVFDPAKEEYRWLKIEAIPQYKKGEKIPYQVYTTFEDITESKKAKDKEIFLSKELQLALDAANMGWWHYNPITGISTHDKRYQEMFGISGSESSNDEILKLLHPEDLPKVLAKVEKALDPVNFEQYSAEYRIIVDNEIRWIEAHGITTFVGNGDKKHAISLVGTVTDITQRKLMDEELRVSEEKYRNALDNMMEGCQIINYDWNYLYVNDAAAEHGRFKKEELLNHNMLKIYPGIENTEMFAKLKRAMIERKSCHLDNYFIYPDGTGHWFELSVFPVPEGIFILSFDVTDRKNALDSLKESEERLKLAQESANIGLWDWIMGEEELIWSSELGKMYGIDPGTKMTYGEWGRRVHPDDIKRVEQERDEAIRLKKPFDLEFRILLPSGKIKWINAKGRAFYDENAEVYRVIGVNIDITEVKTLENELKESEQKFRELVENAADALFVHDFQGNFVDVNRQACESLGYTREELLKMNVTDLELDFDLDSAQEEWAKIKPGEPFTLYGHQVRKDGTVFPVEVRFAMVEINREKMIMGLVRDITTIKKAENELKNINKALMKRDDEFRYFINSAPVAIAMLDRKMKYIAASLRWIEDYNLEGQELHGRSHYDIFPEITDEVKEVHKRALTGSIERADDDKFVRADGRVQYIRWEVHPWYSSTGDIGGIIIFSEDISERKKAEEELRESEEKYRHVIETAEEGIVLFDNKGTIIETNPKALELTGTKDEDLVGKNLTQIVPDIKIDLDEAVGAFKDIISGKPISKTEWEYVNKKGERKFVKANYSAMEKNGKKEGIVLILEDITDLKLREMALRENEQFLENIIENIPDMIFVKSADELKFERVNKAAEETWGYKREELIGKTDHDFFPEDEADFYTKNDREVLNKKKLRDIPEETIHTQYRGERILHTKKIPLLDEKNHPTHLLGISEDITKRKIAENDLKRSLNEKEALLREIHHRVKNNMQIISSLLNLQTGYVLEEEAKDVLRDSQSRVKTMAMIHEKLYMSSDLGHINFKEYAEKLVSDIFYTYGVEIDTIKPVISIAEVDMNMETAIPLGLIINELVTNSLKFAFKDKNGTITVKLETKGDEYTLIIADDGVGLPEDFDFEKSESLGLKLVNSLVNQIDGDITLDSSNGTEYHVNFRELGYVERF
ncbi:MAG: PAS domain S-box [Methanobacterium sp. Maddingley MBC34]|nr:MAG: PAS domain S-box [Methanobacterium sp. Maddingley MBC34]